METHLITWRPALQPNYQVPKVPGITAAVLVAAGFILRLPHIGNPLFDIDEQFYLLVGDRMLHGSLPYVDIWDRKPLGLFLIYATIRLLGGEGIVQYQLAATLSAIATAVTIAQIGRRMTGAIGAGAGGLAYLVWLELLGGGGGQSPVFYNLLTALAAHATLRAVESPALSRQHGRVAMLAMGVALQIKPTAVFEGCLFGAAFLWLSWARDRRMRSVLLTAPELLMIALAPTFLAFALYIYLGHAGEFWFANVTSIFLRTAPPNAQPGAKLVRVFLVLLPLAVTATAGFVSRWRDGGASVHFVAAWTAAALAGLLSVAPYYNHYALPLLVPLTVASSLAFGRGALWLAAGSAVSVAMLRLSGFPDLQAAHEARSRLERMSNMVAAHLNGGCLFVFQGPPILYLSTGACTVSPFVFPAHLNYLGEAGAIGIDPAAATQVAIAARPAVIVTSKRSEIVDPNPATWLIIETALRRDYKLVGTARVDYRLLGIYARVRAVRSGSGLTPDLGS